MVPQPRYVLPGQPQHVIQRGNNGDVIFVAEADYRFFSRSSKMPVTASVVKCMPMYS
jgi:hypothetical protein